MPEIIVHLAAGRTPDQKRALMTGITKAVVDSLAVPPEVVVVSVIETPKDHKSKGGVLFSER